jgi:hypothetical protein
MTMVPQLRWPIAQVDWAWVARSVAGMCLALWMAASHAAAQEAPMHYRHGNLAPPGAIGSVRLQRGGPLPGYFQPVEIRAPAGARVSMAVGGTFDQPLPTPLNVGLLIAPVYRLKVSNIPGREGEEVYPTVEVIDRLYPPGGQERRFPIPVELSRTDLELALEGHYITRVIYLEDPEAALPVAQRPDDAQEWFDAGPGVNPVEEADRWGRPMAILRMGGRVPDETQGPDAYFMGHCPPFTMFRPWTEQVRPRPLGAAPQAAANGRPGVVGGTARGAASTAGATRGSRRGAPASLAGQRTSRSTGRASGRGGPAAR